MYGWIVDGISSLFEPVTGQDHTEWPARSSGSGEGARRQDSQGRPAKRNYKSVHVADNIRQSDPVEAKRRKKDVVVSFVKKTVAGLAGLLRLKKPLSGRGENPGSHEETHPITLMGIDELHTSWLNGTDWKMDKAVGGVNDMSAKNPFQSSLPPLIRKCNGTTLPAALPDRGKTWGRRASLQLLPSRPALRVGTTNPEPIYNGCGHNRCYKPSLTVEEAIKQNNKEHYRRLLEMVTEKYSKSQPLPFNQAKPHDESLLQVPHKTSASERTFDSVSRRVVCTAAPNVFTYRNTTATKDRWGGLSFNKSHSEEEIQPVRYIKTKETAEVDLSTEVATRLNLVDRDASALSVSETQSGYAPHVRHSEDIPRLTKEMVMEVSEALAQRDPNLVLSAAFKLRITQRDLSTLQEGGWLNDEVINFYLSLIMERRSSDSGRLKVYTFSTFFYPKLRGGAGGQAGGHVAVKRWTKAVDLFMFDLILVPLHLGVHWALAVIDLKLKTVKSYDSMGQRHDDICNLLLLYLKEEHKAKKGRELDSARWTVGSLKDIPQQKNGSDCGVFACKYADYIAKGKPLTFKQGHMPLFRKLMMWEILNQKLL
ncbi:sentrin-specific protease 2 [Girardinichthys multiradiatus]|uniref:sentrin-specific protease 2 n=1 Tax=Girardinichthys multiradiatus TaxID=208333 RepID=UPI001FAE289F|nr:sentrin-specific protease 2 [Girardinichthys multiradiatus]